VHDVWCGYNLYARSHRHASFQYISTLHDCSPDLRQHFSPFVAIKCAGTAPFFIESKLNPGTIGWTVLADCLMFAPYIAGGKVLCAPEAPVDCEMKN
jgi:hypothetical protein